MKALTLAGRPNTRWRTYAALAIVLLAMVTTLIAAVTYRSVAGDIDSQWRQSTRDIVLKSRLALIGVAHAVIAGAQTPANASSDNGRCGVALRQAMSAHDEVVAIHVESDDGQVCDDAKAPELAALLTGAIRSLEARALIEVAPGVSLSAEVVEAQGSNLFAIQVAASERKSRVAALIDPGALGRAIELEPAPGEIVAFMSGGREILAMGGVAPSDTSWLPTNAVVVGSDYQVATMRSQSGGAFSYATQPIIGSDLYILKRFSDSARQAIQLRFVALALAPILLAALCFTFASAIRSELLRGLDVIKTAMTTRNGDDSVGLAADNKRIQRELREFVASYNEMAREAGSRAQSLRTSLAENEFLLRELNHRVKSSLQIIQSYVSLTRRLDRESGRQTSAAAIEARVQVLSTAYRKAFSEGRMRDVRIRQFAEDIVANLSHLLEGSGLAIELKADVAAALVIDRAIPLGLAVVESLIAGMSADGAHVVVVRIDQLEDLRVEIRIWTDGALRKGEPNAKLLAGLALQLGAIVDDPGPGTILHWRFQGRPPPVILSRGEPPHLA
jgi:two-component sensor histidine kinase